MTGEQVKEVFKIIFHFNLTFEILKTNDLAVEMVIATIIDNKSSITLLHCLKSVTNFVIKATNDNTNKDFLTTDSFFISAKIDLVSAIISALIISNNILTKRAITLDANCTIYDLNCFANSIKELTESTVL